MCASARPLSLPARFCHAPPRRRRNARRTSARVRRRVRWASSSTTGASTSPAARVRSPAPPRPAPPTTNCVAPPAPSTTAARLERMFAYLQTKNVRNVELYGYPGNPFPGTNPATPLNTAGPAGAARARRLVRPALRLPPRQPQRGQLGPGDRRRRRSSARRSSARPTRSTPAARACQQNLDQRAADEPPRQALGRGRRRPGVLPQPRDVLQPRRSTTPACMKTQWQFLMDHTDPRYVRAQIDLGWAVSGANRTCVTLDEQPDVRARASSASTSRTSSTRSRQRRHGRPARARRRRHQLRADLRRGQEHASGTTSTSTTRSPRATTAASTRSPRPTRASPR